MIDRRSFLRGMVGAIAAPAVIKSGILMPVKEIIMPEFTVIPISNGGTEFTEIARITREAYISRLQMQIYTPSPSWVAIL